MASRTLLYLACVSGLLWSSKRAHAEASAELWLAPTVKHKIADDLKLRFTPHVRFQDNISELESIMPTLALSYRVHPSFKLAGGYRFAYKRTGSGDFDNRHRLHLDATASQSFGALKVAYRLRLQNTVKEDESNAAVRNRLKLKFGLNKKTEGVVSAEVFHDRGKGYEKLRLTLGADRKIAKQDVSVFYRYERPNDESDATLHIVGLGFDYSP